MKKWGEARQVMAELVQGIGIWRYWDKKDEKNKKNQR